MKKMDFNKVYDRTGTSCAKWDYVKQEFGTDDVLPMWVADMDLPSPPEVVEAISERIKHPLFGYTRCIPELLDTIVKKMKDEYDWEIKPEWIVLNYNVLLSISTALQSLSRVGDEVLIQTPVYYPFYSITKNSGCQVVKNPLKFENNTYKMDFDHLNKCLEYSPLFGGNKHKIKMSILCNPHNPVGRAFTKEELLEYGEICLKNNIAIISDEIHCDVVFKGHKHIPIASLSKELEQNTITCMSGGKTFNLASLSIAFSIIPNDKWRRAIKEAFTHAPSVLSMYALNAAINAGQDYYIAELLEYLEDNYKYLKEFIKTRIPKLSVIDQEATFLTWINCSQLGMTREQLKDFMLREVKVAVDYGYVFGEDGEDFVRLNIAVPRAILTQAMERFEKAINDL